MDGEGQKPAVIVVPRVFVPGVVARAAKACIARPYIIYSHINLLQGKQIITYNIKGYATGRCDRFSPRDQSAPVCTSN